LFFNAKWEIFQKGRQLIGQKEKKAKTDPQNTTQQTGRKIQEKRCEIMHFGSLRRNKSSAVINPCAVNKIRVVLLLTTYETEVEK
jgi:hypothetical protein